MLGGHSEQRGYQGHRLLRFPTLLEESFKLVELCVCRVARLELRRCRYLLKNRIEGRARVVGGALIADAGMVLAGKRIEHRLHDPALADTCFTDQQNELSLSALRLSPALLTA